MGKQKITLKFLQNEQFSEIYQKLVKKENCNDEELTKLLSVAIILLNNQDENIKHLGYRIIVAYCNYSHDYNPLYEVAINSGLYPISKFINDQYINNDDKNFFTEWNDCYTKQYQKDNIIETSQQRNLNAQFKQLYSDSLAVVAPTSYGKSELINKLVNENRNKNICIVATTKALLAQTRKRIKDSGVLGERKIITNSEMFHNNMNNFVAVLTQERLNRLLKKNTKFSFDYVIIDEAHELLDDNSRSHILARDIIILKHRNKKCIFKFLTPFIHDPQNLKIRYTTYNLEQITITEYLKSEKYYIHDLENKKYALYDQFLNQTWNIDDKNMNSNEEDVIINYSDRKNVVYLNKPKDIENVAIDLSKKLPDINSPKIDEACENLKKYVHPDYKMISCLKKGVVYHHGSVSDSVRMYIEKLYKELPDIRYIVTSSTLLSGINLPATRIFLLDIRKGRANLRLNSFRNLIGRICRFNQIFDRKKGSLKLLEPEIHIVISPYLYKNANVKNFLAKVAKVDTKYKDEVKNILLKNSDSVNDDELKKQREYLKNFQQGILPDETIRTIRTDVGKACIMNDVTDFDVFKYEQEMQRRLDILKNQNETINDVSVLMQVIQNVLLFPIFNSDDKNNDLYKLKEESVRKFYELLLTWRMENQSFSEMINSVFNYWSKLYHKNKDVTVYAGRWGNAGTNNLQKNQFYFRNSERTDIINLAIVRVKEEQDFITNSIMKFVEVLNDLHMLDFNFYLKVNYGTDNPKLVCMLKNGYSLNISNLLLTKYGDYLEVDVIKDEVSCSPNIIAKMKENNENSIRILEVQNLL